ncbi:MAG: hypothetical protein EHM81_12930, partial [Chloroflexi bacterium]
MCGVRSARCVKVRTPHYSHPSFALHLSMNSPAIQIHQQLLEFYGEPLWRNPLPPVDELVSTILSQNTNDTNRDRAFNALRAGFPTWESVRDASAAEVVECIRVAGLANQKGPRIQQVLNQITGERG